MATIITASFIEYELSQRSTHQLQQVHQGLIPLNQVIDIPTALYDTAFTIINEILLQRESS